MADIAVFFVVFIKNEKLMQGIYDSTTKGTRWNAVNFPQARKNFQTFLSGVVGRSTASSKHFQKKTISFDYKAGRHKTLIIITNYEHFQEGKKQAADRQWTGDGQETSRKRAGNEQQYKKEEGKKKEESLSPASAGPPPAGMSEPSRGTPEWFMLHYDDWREAKSEW